MAKPAIAAPIGVAIKANEGYTIKPPIQISELFLLLLLVKSLKAIPNSIAVCHANHEISVVDALLCLLLSSDKRIVFPFNWFMVCANSF